MKPPLMEIAIASFAHLLKGAIWRNLGHDLYFHLVLRVAVFVDARGPI